MANSSGVSLMTGFGIFMTECWKITQDDLIRHEDLINFQKQCSVWWYNLSENERSGFEDFAEKANVQNKLIIDAYDKNSRGLPTFDEQFKNSDHVLNYSDKPENSVKMMISTNTTKFFQGNPVKSTKLAEQEITDRVAPYLEFVKKNWRNVALTLAKNYSESESIGPMQVNKRLHELWNSKFPSTGITESKNPGKVEANKGKKMSSVISLKTNLQIVKDKRKTSPQNKSSTKQQKLISQDIAEISSSSSPKSSNISGEHIEETVNTIDLDKILELPTDESKAEDAALDEIDRRIVTKDKLDKIVIEKLDSEIAEQKQKKIELRARQKENAVLRNRIEIELTESKVRSMFHENLQYLKDISNGKIESARHKLYNKSIQSRHALYYAMITDPFTDLQLDWILDEMSKIWMKTEKEQMDNKDYVWKVLIPEAFIKLYMDFFKIPKEEAMTRIRETPLHYKDRLKEFLNNSDRESD